MRHGNAHRKLNRTRRASQGHVRQHGGGADQARADRHHAAEGEGSAADRREAGHARQARRPACAPPGDRRRCATSPWSRSSSRCSARATRTATAAIPASSRPASAMATRAPVAVIEFVDRDVDAKGARRPRPAHRRRGEATRGTSPGRLDALETEAAPFQPAISWRASRPSASVSRLRYPSASCRRD